MKNYYFCLCIRTHLFLLYLIQKLFYLSLGWEGWGSWRTQSTRQSKFSVLQMNLYLRDFYKWKTWKWKKTLPIALSDQRRILEVTEKLIFLHFFSSIYTQLFWMADTNIFISTWYKWVQTKHTVSCQPQWVLEAYSMIIAMFFSHTEKSDGACQFWTLH